MTLIGCRCDVPHLFHPPLATWTNLTTLDLSYTDIPALPHFVQDLKRLTKVVLRGVRQFRFSRLPDALQGLAITSLDLADNGIVDYDFVKAFPFLERLDLQRMTFFSFLFLNCCSVSFVRPCPPPLPPVPVNELENGNTPKLAEIIRFNQRLEVLNLADNNISNEGASIVLKAIPFNSSLRVIHLQRNKVSSEKLKEVNLVVSQKSRFNMISVYLLGYGETGKTTLRTTFKNFNHFTTKWFGWSWTAQTVEVNERTKGLEVDRKVPIGEDTFMQVIDFGGQHHYHHSTHLFTRGARAAYIILANPFEVGFEEQLRYWLRLLVLKSPTPRPPTPPPFEDQNSEMPENEGEKLPGPKEERDKSTEDTSVPQVIIVFSRRDDTTALAEEASAKTVGQKEKELEEVVDDLRSVFKQRVRIQGWHWLDCTQSRNDQLKAFFQSLQDVITSVMNEFKVVIPDKSIPDRIVAHSKDMFYEREALEAHIATLMRLDPIVASGWVDSLLKSQDFFSISPGGALAADLRGKRQEFICTDLQKFGKDLLSDLVELDSTSRSDWTATQLLGMTFPRLKFDPGASTSPLLPSTAEKFSSLDPEKRWLRWLPLLLCSLNLAFEGRKGTSPRKASSSSARGGSPVSAEREATFIIPCAIPSHTGDTVSRYWTRPPGDPGDAFTEGRRLVITDELSMFHPAFLPQLVCEVLSAVTFDDTQPSLAPIIWPGGVVIRGTNKCLVGLYMHGAFIAEKLQERMGQRRHGEPERLQTLDLLVKGENEAEAEEVMTLVLDAVTVVARRYWTSLTWGVSVLLPASVRSYFSLRHRKYLAVLSCDKAAGFQPWRTIRETIIQHGSWPEGVAEHSPFTSLHLACHEGDVDLLASLISSTDMTDLIDKPASNGMTPLQMSCQHGHLNIIKYMIATGCFVNVYRNWFGMNAVRIAEEAKNVDVTAFLRSLKKNPLEARTKCREDFRLPGIPCIFHLFLPVARVLTLFLLHD